MPGPALRFGPDHYTAQQAVDYVSFTLISNYVLYATATILVYELFTSLDDEVARVWSLKWRLPKFLFMLNRYLIRALLVCLWILADYPGTSAEFCRIYSYWQMIPLRLAILAAQALVVIRVWAIYNNSRRMFWVLTILYSLEFIAMALCITVATYDTQGAAQPAPLSCALNSTSGYLLHRFASGTWIAPVCFEFIMLVITLAKLVPRWRWGGEDGVLGSGGSATLDILARDSLVYFGFIFTFSLTNAIIYELNFSAYYHSILLGPTSAISCIAVSRMMINIRAPTVSSSSAFLNPGNCPTEDALDPYARPDLSFAVLSGADEGNDDYHRYAGGGRGGAEVLYQGGGIPSPYLPSHSHSPHPHSPKRQHDGGAGGFPHTLPRHASTRRASAYRPLAGGGGVGSARTSGDVTRVGDGDEYAQYAQYDGERGGGKDGKGGEGIEMGLRKVF
ncbi:hypothetical protein C8R46DRAFT_1117442 [Mycena filopes]|nr:hypothetical protein C8R46DRAFT_1117442 [Mycena filopes]